ncbi:MAG: L-aspartate oxidase [Coxiellaceae bacterium]|nr:L-aspartate oxidase [Coxiellaceae bacterium]|tara:strand:+ start:2754 stop:4283 length:1530 start_codon:yes stop_codon:yes gene_type:complete
MNSNHCSHQVVIIGSGLAGMSCALHLAEHLPVALIFEDDHMSGATPWAQGGLSAVSDEQDSFEEHIKDTWEASAYQGKKETIELFAKQCPQEIDWLIKLGVPFTKTKSGTYSLHREGGHSARRIFHTHDHTGLTLAEHFAIRVQQHPNIQCYQHHIAIKLIASDGHAHGVQTWNKSSKQCYEFRSPHIVLATGGAAGLYPLSTCPNPAYGSGIALAHQAGAVVEHMEFTQFHPTRFFHAKSPPFLISEALRGEGALLLTQDGERFMPQYHPLAELAPRDVVSRAIYQTLQKKQQDHVLLDIRHRSEDELLKAFPRIAKHCAEYNIHLHRDCIPVSPAAHYTCGGVRVNHCGETSIRGLYAIGETANTGLHGANRLASNSLSECLVFARRTSIAIREKIPNVSQKPVVSLLPKTNDTMASQSVCETQIQHIQSIMHQYLGIARNSDGMRKALAQLEHIDQILQTSPHTGSLHTSGWKANHMITIAKLIANQALSRTISCGAHFISASLNN